MKDYFIYLICAALSLCFMVVSIQSSHANTNTVSSTVLNNSPSTASAPTILNNNNDICKVGIGGSVQNNILGVATGYVITDEFCERVRTSRALYSYGMKVAAVSLLCQDARTWTAMADAGTPCPVQGLIGAEAAAYWKENPEEIPEGSRYREEYLTANKPEIEEFTDVQNVALYKAMLVVLTGIIIF